MNAFKTDTFHIPHQSLRWPRLTLFCGLQSLYGRMEKLESEIRNRNPETEPNQKNK